MGMVWAPDKKQIEDATAAIRDGWDEKTRQKRFTGEKPKPWELPVVSTEALPSYVLLWIESLNRSGENGDE